MRIDIKERINQIKKNEIPEGYKKTKLGIIPKDWTVCTIGDCLERVGKPVEVIPDEEYVQIGIRSHGKGLFDKEAVTGAELGNKAVFWIEPDCFILNIVFAWEQAIGRTTEQDIGKIGSHRFPMYRPNNNSVDIDYLVYFFMTKRGKDILEAASPGGAGRNKTLGQDRFMKSKLILPPYEEQKKIVHLLSMQDKVIALQQKTIDELLMYKKALLQKMFPSKGDKYPAIRFKGFTDAWELRKLGEVFEQTSNLVNPNEDNIELWSLTVEEGLTPKSERYNREFLVKKEDNFKEVRHGDIVYNPMNMTLGAVGYNGMGKNVAVSGYYTTMITRSGYDAYYIITWLKSPQAISLYKIYATGSLIEKQRVQFPTLSSIPASFPNQEEQTRIGQYFENLNNLITLHHRKLNEQLEYRKGLVQLLLLGIVRV